MHLSRARWGPSEIQPHSVGKRGLPIEIRKDRPSVNPIPIENRNQAPLGSLLYDYLSHFTANHRLGGFRVYGEIPFLPTNAWYQITRSKGHHLIEIKGRNIMILRDD